MSKICSDYMQKQGETLQEWKYRLIIGKAEGTVKLSWGEICNLLGIGCGPEYLRKIAYGILEYKRYLEDRRDKIIASEGGMRYTAEMEELDDKFYAVQRERMKLQDQKRELNKMLREMARIEHIKDELQKAIKDMGAHKPLNVVIKNQTKTNYKREAALLLSDWHKGQLSNNNWNLYNDVEFRKRIETLVKKTITFCNEQKVKTLNVFLIGDLINGLIHVTTRISSMENVIKQTQQVAEIISEMLVKFAGEFELVKVYSSRGNHERVSPNKQESLSAESFFDFIPWYIEARLQHIDNIKITKNEYDDEIVVAKIFNNNIFAVHGHYDRLNSVVQNLSLMLRIFPDYVFVGHYHHNIENEIHGCEVIVNPSLCGTDEYAKNIRKTSKPAQKLIIFDEKEGKLCTYNIKII